MATTEQIDNEPETVYHILDDLRSDYSFPYVRNPGLGEKIGSYRERIRVAYKHAECQFLACIAELRLKIEDLEKKLAAKEETKFPLPNFGDKQFKITYHLIPNDPMSAASIEEGKTRTFECKCKSELDAFNLLTSCENYKPLFVETLEANV